MLTILRRHIFKPLKKQAKHINYYALDSIDSLLGRKDALTPPRRMVAMIGGGDFKAIGQEFLPIFTKHGGLQPGDRVLEIGSGAGRMAVALSGYLNAAGRYDGLDIVPEIVDWCREHITPRYKNFQFQVTDIQNTKYNPKGRYQAREYRFPYDDQSFDFVFLTSVFTHMLTTDMHQYLSEIRRVMKVGKRFLITFFLLNRESSQLIASKATSRSFRHEMDGCWVKDRDVPESEVAYEEELIRKTFETYNLSIDEPIRYGSWCGRDNYLSYQDIIVATRTA